MLVQYPKTIRNFNSFIDGISYAGRMMEVKLPELNLIIANHRGGGMDGSVGQDMGMEAMTAEATLAEWSPQCITAFGQRQRMVLRPVAEGEFEPSVDEIICTLGGRWSMTNFADLKSGSDVPMQLKLEVDYFRMTMNGTELFEIDIQAYKRIIGGVDQLASKRAAMGF